MQVFLIDDDAAHLHAVARFMKQLGFDLAGEAGDGQGALDALRRLADLHAGLRPDLIVTDCQMPVMDGLRFARALRASGDPTPLIMLSGQDSEDVVALAIEAGVNCFVAKPVDAALLAQAVALAVPRAAA